MFITSQVGGYPNHGDAQGQEPQLLWEVNLVFRLQAQLDMKPYQNYVTQLRVR